MQPLHGIRVLDFSTLLPGPLATLLLAEAGAEVIKIERPGRGDEMRSYAPKFGTHSANFALLNRGKRSIAIDLKAPGAIDKLLPLLTTADILVEQFRPGVMERLGLGYEQLKRVNPRLIYCAITGYGQSGPNADKAAHDLNYIAEAGLLGLSAAPDGTPVVPPALIADIGGGAYPAVMNILLALRDRDSTGQGCKLDIAMADNLFTFMYWALGNAAVVDAWPKPGGELVTGGSPRFSIYRTRDDRFLAAAPLEQKFWEKFCELLEVSIPLRDDERDVEATRRAVTDRVRAKTARELHSLFEGQDVCCSIVKTLQEALHDPHFMARGIFQRKVRAADKAITALPVPIAEHFRAGNVEADYPALDEGHSLLKG